MLLQFSWLMTFLLIVLLAEFAAPARAQSPATKPVVTPAERFTELFGPDVKIFEIQGNWAFLLPPTKPAADGTKPWVWFAPTFIRSIPDRSHVWMFERLRANGFTIAGIEVGESYGNPKGREIFTLFYQHLVREQGLSSKACLLPQSRGGLMLYNWAAEHPESVQCIGGIYTVCDLSSYPGLQLACGAFGMTEAQLQEHLAEHNPIDRLQPLVQAKVPILIVHGDVDKVVPLERNSGELIKRYLALGGPGELIVIPGKGHQVCPEFFQSQQLVDFFLTSGKISNQ